MIKPKILSDEEIREQTKAPVVLSGHRRLAQAQNDYCYKEMLGQINSLIDTKKDLVHNGYHGYASNTPNKNCRGCQIEQALQGLEEG